MPAARRIGGGTTRSIFASIQRQGVRRMRRFLPFVVALAAARLQPCPGAPGTRHRGSSAPGVPRLQFTLRRLREHQRPGVHVRVQPGRHPDRVVQLRRRPAGAARLRCVARHLPHRVRGEVRVLRHRAVRRPRRSRPAPGGCPPAAGSSPSASRSAPTAAASPRPSPTKPSTPTASPSTGGGTATGTAVRIGFDDDDSTRREGVARNPVRLFAV